MLLRETTRTWLLPSGKWGLIFRTLWGGAGGRLGVCRGGGHVPIHHRGLPVTSVRSGREMPSHSLDGKMWPAEELGTHCL